MRRNRGRPRRPPVGPAAPRAALSPLPTFRNINGIGLNLIFLRSLHPFQAVYSIVFQVEVEGGQGAVRPRTYREFERVIDRLMPRLINRFTPQSRVTIEMSDPEFNSRFFRNQASMSLQTITGEFMRDMLENYQSSSLPGGNLANLIIKFHVVRG